MIVMGTSTFHLIGFGFVALLWLVVAVGVYEIARTLRGYLAPHASALYNAIREDWIAVSGHPLSGHPLSGHPHFGNFGRQAKKHAAPSGPDALAGATAGRVRHPQGMTVTRGNRGLVRPRLSAPGRLQAA